MLGSPGNNNPDVMRYDNGLRSAMSTTHAAVEESLAQYQATHLPRYAWEGSNFAADLKAKGLPPQPGAPAKWKLPFKPEEHPAGFW